MPAVNPGEVWLTDFGMVAKVRPALVLTTNPAPDELDLVTLLLPVRPQYRHATTALADPAT